MLKITPQFTFAYPLKCCVCMATSKCFQVNSLYHCQSSIFSSNRTILTDWVFCGMTTMHQMLVSNYVCVWRLFVFILENVVSNWKPMCLLYYVCTYGHKMYLQEPIWHRSVGAWHQCILYIAHTIQCLHTTHKYTHMHTYTYTHQF